MASPDTLATQMGALIARGQAEFPDFNDRSAFVATVAGNLDELRQAIGGMPDGHRVVAALADDPDEAARILPLRGTKLGTAIGQFAATKAKPPAAVAPPAPKPPPEPDIYDEKLPMRDWVAARDKQAAQRRTAAKTLPDNRDLSDPNMPMADWVKVFDARWSTHQARRRAR
jgi:hypothetical protein